tara:strand:+ start:52 stop:486 length:435 start_codon:yes stop_codon:yes gene_type:complete
MTIESKNQLIDRLILSIRTKNISAFDENTQKGIIWFGEDGVQKILNEELPLYLNADGVSTLLRFIVNDNQEEYTEVILNLIAEVIKQLEKENLEFGKDYSFAEISSKEPIILIKKVHAEKVMSMYIDYAWSQLSPYVRFVEEEN